MKSNWITERKSKGLSNESLEIVSKTDSTLTPSVNYYGDTRSVLQQETVTQWKSQKIKKL